MYTELIISFRALHFIDRQKYEKYLFLSDQKR